MGFKVRATMMAAALMAVGVQADSITHGGTTVNMDFVNIGYAGNVADSTGYGSVSYNYRMGKFEVTALQWASVIAADSNVGNAGIWSGSQPVAQMSWYETVRFANWLTTGNAYRGAYQFDGSGTLTNINRAAAVSAYGTVYVLPTEDEWYKAAYLKVDGSAYTLYSTGDSAPVNGVDVNNAGLGGPWDVGSGSADNNGTFDMTANVLEWIESAFDGTLDDLTEDRVSRVGSFGALPQHLNSSIRWGADPMNESSGIKGFRVAAIPEPSSVMLIGVGSIAFFLRRKSRKDLTLPKSNLSSRSELSWP